MLDVYIKKKNKNKNIFTDLHYFKKSTIVKDTFTYKLEWRLRVFFLIFR